MTKKDSMKSSSPKKILTICSPDFELERLPESWTLKKFDEVAFSTDYVANGSFATLKANVKYKKEQDFAILVRLTDFTKKWQGNFVYVDKHAYDFLSKSSIEPGDLVIANVGDPGRVFRVPNLGQPMTLGPNSVLVRGRDDMDNGFIAYFFMSLCGQDLISQITTGTAQKKFNKTGLRSLMIPVAPPNEQNRIVAEIEKQFSRLDEAVAALKRIKVNLKRYKASVLKAAVEGTLTEEWRKEHPDVEHASELLKRISDKRSKWIDESIKSGNNETKRLKSKFNKHKFEIPKNKILPHTWQYASFLTASKIVVDCHNKTAPYIDKGISLIRTNNIKNGCLMIEETKYVSNETYAYWSRRCLPEPGDILFTREAPMGEAAIIPDGAKICMGQRIMLIRVFHELVNIKYVLYAIMSPQFQTSFGHGAVGSGVKHLRVGDVESLVIPIPPLIEQNQIVNEIEQKLSVIEEVELELTKNLLRSERLRQSILKKAFSGKLRNQ